MTALDSTDASGGVVANATVTATSVDTGQTQSATTDRRIAVGVYSLTVKTENRNDAFLTEAKCQQHLGTSTGSSR
jgi:hypothetical protein